MFAVIKRFFARLFGRRQIEPPHDPYAYRTAPRKRGPHDRSGAVAVLEPDDDDVQRGKVREYVQRSQ